MTMDRIRVAVARADLVICGILRWAVVIGLLAALLLACVIAALHLARADPPRIDRCDITSEGPEDWSEAWTDWTEEEGTNYGLGCDSDRQRAGAGGDRDDHPDGDLQP